MGSRISCLSRSRQLLLDQKVICIFLFSSLKTVQRLRTVCCRPIAIDPSSPRGLALDRVLNIHRSVHPGLRRVRLLICLYPGTYSGTLERSGPDVNVGYSSNVSHINEILGGGELERDGVPPGIQSTRRSSCC